MRRQELGGVFVLDVQDKLGGWSPVEKTASWSIAGRAGMTCDRWWTSVHLTNASEAALDELAAMHSHELESHGTLVGSGRLFPLQTRNRSHER